MEETKNLVALITKGIQDKKGHGIVIADLSAIDGTICRCFVICQGNSIAESVSDYVRETTGEKPVNCAGLGNNQWVAIDYVDVIVHIFLPETRAFYDIEHLWEDARLTRLADVD